MLVVGILGMVAIANLQYGWTLFVNPLAKQLNAELPAIQIAFTLFVIFETWPVFLEAYLVDRFGPKIIVVAGGILAGAGSEDGPAGAQVAQSGGSHHQQKQDQPEDRRREFCLRQSKQLKAGGQISDP